MFQAMRAANHRQQLSARVNNPQLLKYHKIMKPILVGLDSVT